MKKALLLVILCLAMIFAFAPMALADVYIINTSITGLDMPQAGKTLDFSATSDSSSYSVTSISWDDRTTGTNDLSSSYKAEPGHKYRYYVNVKTNYSGYYFPYIPDSNGTGYQWQFYNGTATLNGTTCYTDSAHKDPGPYAVIYTGSSKQMQIVGYYTVPAVTSVNISLDMPVEGGSLDFSPSKSGSHYSISSIRWRDQTAGDSVDLTSSHKAIANHKYRVDIFLDADSGYAFPYIPNSNGSGYHWQFFDGTAKLNGTTCGTNKDPGPYAVVYATDPDYMEIVYFYTVPKLTDIDDVALKVTAPAVGKKPATSFTATNYTNSTSITAYDIGWLEYDTSTKKYVTMTSSYFEEGKTYRVWMVVKPAAGYFAGGKGVSYYADYTGDYTVNGNKPTAANNPEALAYGDSGTSYAHCLYVEYTFPAMDSAPVITANPQNTAVAQGNNATFSVTATGENLKYQWYIQMPGSSTSQKAGSTSATLTLAKVNMDYNGARVWCEVSNSVGSATSTKATLTVGDNYVFPFTDVYTSDWYYNDVKIANQMKLIDGKSATLFKPNDNMTYAEAIKLAACMNQIYYDGTVTLTPKAAADWYTPYVDYAKAKGIPWNFSNYNAPITRADYVYIFYYALPSSTYTPINSIGSGNIPDVFSYTPRAGEIYAFYRAGILTGNTKHYFLPNDNIRRCEVAAILTRMMDPSTRQHLTL